MPHGDSTQIPDTAVLDALCNRAMTQQIAGQLDLAEELYLAILRADSLHATANHCIGMLRVQRGRTAEALPALLAALQSQPQVADYWLGYLEALLLLGLLQDAAAALDLGRQHGLAGPQADDFARRLRARLPSSSAAAPATALPATPAPAPPAARSRADRRRDGMPRRATEEALLDLVEQRKMAEAHILARTLTERFPDRGLGWKVLGAMPWAEGRIDDAVTAMKVACGLDAGGCGDALQSRYDPAETAALRRVGGLPQAGARGRSEFLRGACSSRRRLSIAGPVCGSRAQHTGRHRGAAREHRRGRHGVLEPVVRSFGVTTPISSPRHCSPSIAGLASASSPICGGAGPATRTTGTRTAG